MKRQKYTLDEDRGLYMKKKKNNLIRIFLFVVIWSKFVSRESCICLFFTKGQT